MKRRHYGWFALALVLALAVPALAQQFSLPGGMLMQRFSQTLGPTAIQGNASLNAVAQNFTVTGLSTGDSVFVNGPAETTACPRTGARVSAANTLTLTFLDGTTAICTPATGTYVIWAIRQNP